MSHEVLQIIHLNNDRSKGIISKAGDFGVLVLDVEVVKMMVFDQQQEFSILSARLNKTCVSKGADHTTSPLDTACGLLGMLSQTPRNPPDGQLRAIIGAIYSELGNDTMTKTNIYLDYAASTPVDERVVEAMTPYFDLHFGNSSSTHYYGQQAEAGLERSRLTIANAIGCQPHEVIFTSCGSESDNLALRGAAWAARKERDANHILISPVEHHAISRTAQQLASLFDFELEYLPIDAYGRVEPDSVAKRLRPETAIVSVIHANNEIGTLNPIAEIGAVCRDRGIPFHSDAVQGAAHLPIDVDTLNVDLLSIGAHKFYGPKGIGALYIRKGTALISSLTGGSQEYDLRAGTHNLPYIVGMAEAFQLVQDEHGQRFQLGKALRDRIIGTILEEIPDAQLTGHPSQRLPNHASFAFKGVDGNELLMMLDVEGFACSSGSACKTGNPEPSDVLTALGLEPEWSLGSLRVTVGNQTTPEDVDSFLSKLPNLVARSRELATDK
jgi:cysteine desulfurase